MLPHRISLSICTIAVTFSASAALAQDYPNKPIRIYTSAAGGSDDLQARMFSPQVSTALGQPIVVDNRPSFSGIEVTAKAAPDGYSLLFYGSNVWLAPLLQKVSWDPVKDFAPVVVTESSPNALIVFPGLPVKSVKELVALAKAKPGALNYASGPIGGGAHLGAELFKSLAGVDIVRVPYKTGAAALAGLIGGEAQVQFAGAASVTPNLKTGRVNALAVTSTEPSPLFPGLPTVAATVPGYEAVSYTSLFAPAGTPPAVIRRLNQEIVRVIRQPDIKEKLLNAGIQVVGSTPEELAAWMKADMARMDKVIKDAGIKIE